MKILASAKPNWGIAPQSSYPRFAASSMSARARRSVIAGADSAAGGAVPVREDDSPKQKTASASNPTDKFVKGLRARLAMDPNFPFKLCAEVALDEIMTLGVNIAVRGNPLEWALAAKLQVLCQMLTAAINDIILVYCLAPVKPEAGEEKKEKKAEIAHIFQEGNFSLAERASCFVQKGVFYATIGAFSCALSMAIALGLSGQSSKITAEYLLRAFVCGAMHMGLSANTRYQIVNGIERVLYSILPQSVARTTSVGVRLSNNLLGARLWIVMTVLTGLA